jgi:hypothetical protein
MFSARYASDPPRNLQNVASDVANPMAKVAPADLILHKAFDFIGADGGTRTRTGLPPRDFKSLASTISPRPRSDTL